MEIINFATENFLSSFPGTLMAVELIVFATKSFPIINKISTKLYTFILAVIHLVIIQIINKKVGITVEFIYMLFINSLIVEVILCGGYDTLINKFKSITDTLSKAEEEILQINSGISKDIINNKGIESNNGLKDTEDNNSVTNG